MSLVRTNLLNDLSSEPNGTGGFTVPSFTPPNNSLLVALTGMMTNGGSTDESGSLTITDSAGLTWTSRAFVGNASAWSIGVHAWTAPVTTGVSMTSTFDCGAVDIYQYFCTLVAYTGANGVGVSGTKGSTATDGSDSVTLGSPPATTSEIIGCIMQDPAGSAGATPDTGHTELYDVFNPSGLGFQSQVRDPGSSSTAFSWADVSVSGSLFKGCALAIEIVELGGTVYLHTEDGFRIGREGGLGPLIL